MMIDLPPGTTLRSFAPVPNDLFRLSKESPTIGHWFDAWRFGYVTYEQMLIGTIVGLAEENRKFKLGAVKMLEERVKTPGVPSELLGEPQSQNYSAAVAQTNSFMAKFRPGSVPDFKPGVSVPAPAPALGAIHMNPNDQE